MPVNNIIPKSYSSILKFFDLDKLKSKIICSVCSNELAAKQICENTHCKQAKLTKKYVNKKDPLLT